MIKLIKRILKIKSPSNPITEEQAQEIKKAFDEVIKEGTYQHHLTNDKLNI